MAGCIISLCIVLTNTQFSSAFAKIYQARYLTGMVAGAAQKEGTKRSSNCVGYLAAYPIPEVVRGLNAFTLGCLRTNPDCVVKAIYIQTWHDDHIETNAAHFMYDQGCDIVAQVSKKKAGADVILDTCFTSI